MTTTEIVLLSILAIIVAIPLFRFIRNKFSKKPNTKVFDYNAILFFVLLSFVFVFGSIGSKKK